LDGTIGGTNGFLDIENGSSVTIADADLTVFEFSVDDSTLIISTNTIDISNNTVFTNGELQLNATLTLFGGQTWSNLVIEGLNEKLLTPHGGQHALTTTGIYGATMIGATVTWTNGGDVDQESELTIGDFNGPATVVNGPTGTYDFSGFASIAAGSSSSYFYNEGLFTEESNFAKNNVIDVGFINSGTVEVFVGTLDFQNALMGSGTTEVATHATLEVDNTVGAGSMLVFAEDASEIFLNDLRPPADKLFYGTLSGYGLDDTIDIGSATFAGYSENAGGLNGLLTVQLGAANVSIKMDGDYNNSDFTSSTNLLGQTLLKYTG
jgi:hypothetical protein